MTLRDTEMEAFTFAVSTQVGFPVYIKMYVSRGTHEVNMLTASQWLLGREAEANPILRSSQEPRTTSCRIRSEPCLGSVCDRPAVGGLKTPRCTFADLIQGIQDHPTVE